jgi:integrase
VDLKNGIIEHVPMKTKRKSKVVRLPIHPVLAAMLKQLKKTSSMVDSYLFPEEAQSYQQDGAAISKRIQKHFEANGIQTTEQATSGHRKQSIVRVGFHSLRHSFVSLCAANRVPQVAIMELVGHGSPAMTRLYSHAGSEQKAKAIAALPVIDFGGRNKNKK